MLWNKIRRKASEIAKNSSGNETGGLIHANAGWSIWPNEEEKVDYPADKCNAYFVIV
jgi:hypothetical protein